MRHALVVPPLCECVRAQLLQSSNVQTEACKLSVTHSKSHSKCESRIWCLSSYSQLWGNSTYVLDTSFRCARLTCLDARQLTRLLLLLSHFSSVRLCATPYTATHQAPPSLGVSRQEHWSGFPFPSPMHESEKSKWSCSVVSDSSWPRGLQPTRLLHPWDFPGKSTGVGCHRLLD